MKTFAPLAPECGAPLRLDRWQEIASAALIKDSISEKEAAALAIRAGARVKTRLEGDGRVWKVEPFEIEKVDGQWVVFFDRAPDF